MQTKRIGVSIQGVVELVEIPNNKSQITNQDMILKLEFDAWNLGFHRFRERLRIGYLC